MQMFTEQCAGYSGVMHHKQVWRAEASRYIPQVLWDVVISPCFWRNTHNAKVLKIQTQLTTLQSYVKN